MDKKSLNEKLWSAAFHGNLEEVKRYIAEGADKEYRNESFFGFTALHVAAERGHLHVVQWLIEECGMVPLDKSRNGETVLHLAAQNGYFELTKWLIEEKGMDPMVKSAKYGYTSLHAAALQGHLHVVQWLIEECGMNPLDRSSKFGFTALHAAALSGHLHVVQWLIEECGMDPLDKSREGDTVLHLAAQSGNFELTKWLIEEKGMDAIVKSAEEGETVLHLAAQSGNFEFTKWLIEEKGMDPMVKTAKEGETVLHLAAQSGNFEFTKWLIEEKGMDPMVKTAKEGETVLHLAAQSGNFEFTKWLIEEKGMDPMVKTAKGGYTSLHLAANFGHFKVVKWLIEEAGMDPLDTSLRDGETTLHLAAFSGNIELTNWLIKQKGMDPMVKTTKEGQTALHLAALGGKLEMTEWLIGEKGMNPMVKTSQEGKTALHLAAENGKLEVTTWLIEEKGMDSMVKTYQGETPYHLAAKEDKDDNEFRRNKKKKVMDYLKTVMPTEELQGASQQKGETPVVRGLQNELKFSDQQFDNLLKTGSYRCYWNRVFLTGKFAVGKTTLAKILVGDEAPIERESTDGIWIYLGRAGMNIKEKVWIFLEKGTVLNASVQSLLRSEEIKNQSAITIIEELQNPCAANPSVGFQKDVKKESKLKAFQRRILKVLKGKTNTRIKTLDDSSTNMTGTSRKDSSKTMEISDDDIIKLVRSECMKGNYEMTIVPIDLWDFGGQKIYHLTHQLFISSRGTFVLIFNGGESINEEDGAYLVHWVNSVLTYCKTLKKDDEFPKILFVATHKDQVKGDIEEQRHSLEISIEILFQNHGGKKHLKYRPLIFVDARNKDDKDIDELKKQLVEVALDHPRCGELMPTKFVPLELQLAKKGEDKQKIVTIDELKRMNKQNEIMALDNDELKLFLKVNHALGKLIFFDEAGLRDKVIIDPVFLIDVLRSIVTEEQFWPQHLLRIFKTLKESGKLLKKELYEIWKQECFQMILEHKEYMVEMLVHLDIICRQKDYTNGSDYFMIPCMISTKREDNLRMPFDRSIHLAYTFKDEVVPPAVLYRFIATFITIWKLQVSQNSSLLLFTDSADVSIDEEHDMRFDIQRNKLIITLSHKKMKTSIVSTIASTAQECLTHAITQISKFYFSVTEDSDCPLDLPFTTQVGIVCGTDLCFLDHTLLSKDEWICQDHNRKHETDIVSRWFADKVPVKGDRCNALCPGLDNTWLDRQLDDKRLGRLAVELTKEETKGIYMHLKERKPDQTWKKIESNKTDEFDININALHDWKKSTHLATFNNIQESMKREDIDAHKLCQILRDVQINKEIPMAKLNLKPLRSDMKILLNHIGKETFQLGIELGLSVVEMHQIQSNHVTNLRGQTEEVLCKWRKQYHATYEVLVKTLYRLDLAGVVESLTYEVGVKEEIEDRISDYRNEIIEELVISDILDDMMTHLVVSVDDRRRIEQHAGQDDQNKALVDLLMNRREPTYTVFVKSLQKNGYQDLATNLKYESQDLSSSSKSSPIESKRLSVVTNQHYKVRLQKNYSLIVASIKHDDIVDHLITSDVLSVDERQKIEACKSQKEKNRELMDMLLHSNICKHAYTEFLKSLGEDPTYRDLAGHIDNTEVTSEDMATFQCCFKSTGYDAGI